MQLLIFNKLVDGLAGGELRYDTEITTVSGRPYPELVLKVWQEGEQVFVESQCDIPRLVLQTRAIYGYRIPWFGGRHIRIVPSWGLRTNDPLDFLSRDYVVLRRGKKAELPLNRSLYPEIVIEKTGFRLFWECEGSGESKQVSFRCNNEW
jgi:hypothetical protein